jgi:transmembrane sensor
LHPLTREGIDWIVRLRSGSATESDLQAWQAWRAQSPAHAQAFREALRLKNRLQSAGKQLLSQTASPHPARINRRMLIGSALAASTAGYLALRPPLNLWPSLSDVVADLRADFSTSIGEQRQVALDAGQSITLNTQTRLAWRSLDGARALALMSGEALLTSESGAPESPAIIAGAGISRVKTGLMNIRAFEGSVRVTCVEGEVTVAHRGANVLLTRQQQLVYDDASIGAITAIDAQIATAWQSGLLIFRDEPLRNVVDEINRYRRGKIMLANAALEQRLVNGTFHLSQIDHAPVQIEQFLGARARELPGGIVILS